MTIDTSETKDLPAHDDQHAAGLYQAMAARVLYRFIGFRDTAVFYGAEFPAEYLSWPNAIGPAELYQRAVDEWVSETPKTATATKALIEFAGCLSADKELDALHQVIALSAAAGWMTELANDEFLTQHKAAEARLLVRRRRDGAVEIEQPDGTRGVYRREGGAA
jgi:hypothetical protein